MAKDTTVIIGGGQAAARCSVELRRLGYSGRVVLYGAEPVHPYQRPELSKSYLARPASAAELNVLSQDQAESLDIELVLGTEVTGVDARERVVYVNGQREKFDKLVFACGGNVRKYENALSLRTQKDAEILYTALTTEKKLTVIGGGWLGLEVAATARAHGLHVTLHEQQDRLGARSLPVEISKLLLQHQRDIGVDVRLNSSSVKAGEMEGVVCACVGITPNDALASAAGIECERGIVVNQRQMTSEPNIFAIGDCARESGLPAMENWAYANVSAERAAYAVCDIALPIASDLWMWSKQGDLLLQMRGNCLDAEQCVARRKGESAAYFYLSDSRLQGCIAINDPALFGQSRKLHRANHQLDIEALLDDRVPLSHVKAKPV